MLNDTGKGRDTRLSIINNAQTKVKNNLSGNKYGRYIKREHIENRIINFLMNESENYQIISGFGGMGKSFLIFTVLNQIVKGLVPMKELSKKIDSIIWVTDSFNPGDLNINKLIDEINQVNGTFATTHSYNDAYSNAKKFFEIPMGKISILVVDNFETITDEKLRQFIFDLPTTTKVILTSKLNRDACIQRGFIKMQNAQCINDCPIPPFTFEEWQKLYYEIVKDKTKEQVTKWAKNFSEEELNALLRVIHEELDGVPFPFEGILSRIAEENLKDEEDIREFIKSEVSYGDDYNRIISYSWDKASSKAKSVLIASVLRGYLSYLDFQQISNISGLKKFKNTNQFERGSDLERAVRECVCLNLMKRNIEEDMYYLPSIVYRYVIDQIQNNDQLKLEFSTIINNWICFYIKKTDTIGMCYNNTELMKEFDESHQKEALLFVLEYCFKCEKYKEYIRISNNMRYFFYTRAIWDNDDDCIHVKRANAANMIGDELSELEAYIYNINIAAKYCQFECADRYLPRVRVLIEKLKISPDNMDQKKNETYFRYQHTLGLLHYRKKEYDEAFLIWDKLFTEPICTEVEHDLDAAKRWYIKAWMKKSGKTPDEYAALEKKILDALKEAEAHSFERAIIDYTFMLMRVYVECGDISKARYYINSDKIAKLIETTNDALYKAKYYLWRGFCTTDNAQRKKDYAIANKTIRMNSLESAIKPDEEFLKVNLSEESN